MVRRYRLGASQLPIRLRPLRGLRSGKLLVASCADKPAARLSFGAAEAVPRYKVRCRWSHRPTREPTTMRLLSDQD